MTCGAGDGGGWVWFFLFMFDCHVVAVEGCEYDEGDVGCYEISDV